MPVSVTYSLTAAAVPALVTPTGIHDPAVDAPLLAPALLTGDKLQVPVKSATQAVGLEDAFRYGGGAYAVRKDAGNGLLISDGGGLTCNVATGVGLLDWPVVRTAIFPVALTDNATNYLWLLSSGVPTKVVGSLTPPSAACVYLGQAVTVAGAITLLDRSGVPELRGGTLYRRTGDTGVPGDTPPAGLQIVTETAGGAYLWDGGAYRKWVNAGGVGYGDLAAPVYGRHFLLFGG